MGETHCFNILKDIEATVSCIRFSDDSRLQELYDMTVSGDRDRLNNAKKRWNQYVQSQETWEAALEAAKERLRVAEEELDSVQRKCDQLRNGQISVSSSLESVERLKKEISFNRDLLAFYKEATGVRFIFNSPEDVVSGYVGIKGETPRESKLEPFMLSKLSRHVTEDIWGKISAAVDGVPLNK